ncbi:CoA transferase [Streptomyces sp. NPDC008092]|uniref:CoA transferase n=1 Tax=Streptomyces sp. NPDC008092 TaxID=3364808 RepID=UPI0036E0FE4A
MRPRPRSDRTSPTPATPKSAAGLLAVDFSAPWTGPLCAHLLGTAGAKVVKVETPSRPDGARLGNPAFYDPLHAGHASVALDPADPDSRTALHELVGRADAVIEASRPRTLDALALDAQAEAASPAIPASHHTHVDEQNAGWAVTDGSTSHQMTTPHPRHPTTTTPPNSTHTTTAPHNPRIPPP